MSRSEHLQVIALFLLCLGYFAGHIPYQDAVVVLLAYIAVVAVREVGNDE